MLEQVGEPLGSIGRIPWHAGRDRACDEEELAFDGGRHPPGAPLHHGVEAPNRPLEAVHHGKTGTPSIPVLRERDDLSHRPIMRPPSDTPGRSFGSEPWMPQATRTEFTGASRSWAVNHEAPASPEPNTSPDVAPKYRPIPEPSPSTANACRRIVR
jgi:hypothetical protein